MRHARGLGLIFGLLLALPAGAEVLEVGHAAPEISLSDVTGTTHRLSEYRGRAILLNFWATWCIPCRTEIPSMERAYRRLGQKGLAVLAVNLDAGRGPVEAFIKEHGVTFPVLLDPQGTSSRAYHVLGLPTSYLIDREGRLVLREIGPRDWSEGEALRKLEALLP